MNNPTMSAAPYVGGAEFLGGHQRLSKGKVRDIYALPDDQLLFVTSDRVSAFDVVMDQGVAHKGRVLTAIAAHWFARTTDIVPNHLLSCAVEDVPGLSQEEQDALRGRIMIVRKASVLPVEWVVRGYITGSGWKEYLSNSTVCGHTLPPGLQQCERLAAPLLTPTTKSDVHDEPISETQAAELVGQDIFERAKQVSFALFARGTEELAQHDILLADTKFEIGMIGDEMVLIDEALTPDSSRFWPQEEWRLGSNPPSYDKQILRDYLETLDWNKEYPAPAIDPAVLERVTQRYLEVCVKLTGHLPEGVNS